MTDRELLELAAKAAGIDLIWDTDGDSHWCFVPEFKPPHNRRESDKYAGRVWNPLTDDGDALRLAVKLEIDLMFNHTSTIVQWSFGKNRKESHENSDPYAATRRAIVRAAAEIGKGME